MSMRAFIKHQDLADTALNAKDTNMNVLRFLSSGKRRKTKMQVLSTLSDKSPSLCTP